MNKTQLIKAARELAATLETLEVDFWDNPDPVDEYLIRIGINPDCFNSTPEEAQLLEAFYDEFCAAWEERKAEGAIDDSIHDAFDEVVRLLSWTIELWHQEHSLLEEFWGDFERYADVEELDEYMTMREGQFVSAMHELMNQYEPKAESEYDAQEQKLDYQRRAGQVLSGLREGFRAIRAKARVVKNADGMVRMIVKNSVVVDVVRV